MSIHKVHTYLKPRFISRWLHDLSSDYGGEVDYSLHLPKKFRIFAFIGIVGVFVAIVLWQVFNAPALSLTVLGIALLHASPAFIGVVLLWSTRGLRLRLRDRMVQSVNWRGDEHILDVGTGSGITLIGCAQRLITGKAVGIDHWNPNAGGGSADTFWKNVELAEVSEVTELHNMNICNAPLDDDSFDVIMSSFAVHHFGGIKKRCQAGREMIRLLKPGGQVLICDVGGALKEIEEEMLREGFKDVVRLGWAIHILSGEKSKCSGQSIGTCR